jgi:plastocyanin
MKKLFTLIAFFAALTIQVNATKHTISISGSTYSPALLTVHLGDTVTISGSIPHPLAQVSKATWNNNGATSLPGGFGPTTKSYTFTMSTSDTIYYVCTAHVDFGMKGRIVVGQFSGIDDLPSDRMTVSLYPNPVTATGTIKLGSIGTNPVSVRIFDITGQMEKDLSSSLINVDGDYYAQFDASRMTSGFHFALVSDGKSKVVKKFEVIR